MVVWSGAGSLLLLFFIGMLFVFNTEYFLNYRKELFELLNWWHPCLASAIAAWSLNHHATKAREHPREDTLVGRMFISFGNNHHVYWIPLRYWSFILFGLGLSHFFIKR